MEEDLKNKLKDVGFINDSAYDGEDEVAKYYEKGNIPSTEELVADINYFLEGYSQLGHYNGDYIKWCLINGYIHFYLMNTQNIIYKEKYNEIKVGNATEIGINSVILKNDNTNKHKTPKTFFINTPSKSD